MKTIAYARLPEEEERNEFKQAVRERLPEAEFIFDGLAGQIGLSEVMRRVQHPGINQLVVKRFSDLGRDITTAIRNAKNQATFPLEHRASLWLISRLR